MRPETVDLMGRAYGLTGAETEILAAFCDGASLRRIAEDRGRSHATIRTQFQSIAEKTGVGGQAELMRSSQAISRFTEEIGGLARATSRPTRKRFDVMRPGGAFGRSFALWRSGRRACNLHARR
jgi:DNA-binding CsgD family transcriptional regulator